MISVCGLYSSKTQYKLKDPFMIVVAYFFVTLPLFLSFFFITLPFEGLKKLCPPCFPPPPPSPPANA